MALIYDSRFRALDSNGDPLVGATLTVKDAGTSTLSSIYRDNGLSDAMTNPTSGGDVADAGGWFPQIFTEEARFDITLKDADGVTVQTWEDVSGLGEGTSAFSRDFGNSRAQITGSGGVVRFEGGPPEGDDTGGQVEIGGWDDTQAETMVLDAAAIDTTGKLKENSKKLSGVVVGSASFSAAANVDIALTNDPSGVEAYDIDLVNVIASTGVTSIAVTFSYDNGATYASANYDDGSSITLFTSGGNLITTNGPLSARIRMNTSASMQYQTIFGSCVGGSTNNHVSGGGYHQATARVTNVRFTPNTGTLTGKYRVVPLRGTGDA